MSKSLTQRVLDKDWTELKDDFETVIAKKISNKILAKKQDFLNKAKGMETSTDDNTGEKQED